MKAQSESVDHASIRSAKEELSVEARILLSNSKLSELSTRMTALVRPGQFRDKRDGVLSRLLTDTLTSSERKRIRGIAGLLKD